MTVMEELTTKEKSVVEELRRRFANEMRPELYNDMNLFYRFSKARDFNIENAEAMLRKHLQWRKELEVDTIVTNYKALEAMRKYFPGGVIGFDKEGSTIQYFGLGNLDPKGIRRSYNTFMDLVKNLVQIMEEEMIVLQKQSAKMGKSITQSTYILDFKGVGFALATDKKAIQHGIYLTKMYQDNFPERLKSAYLINVSPYVTLLFNMFKVFLADSILKKIHFCSPDEVKDKLLEIIHADDLPAFLGGNKTDPDGNPLCKTFVNHTGKVPEKYFIHTGKRKLGQQEGVKKVVVPRSSFVEVEFEVVEPCSMLEWEFEMKCRDIGFGLFYKDTSGGRDNIVEIVPFQRLDTDESTETGMHRCEKEGIYVMLFDNSYSWMRSKELYYRAVVRTPKEHEEQLEKDL